MKTLITSLLFLSSWLVLTLADSPPPLLDPPLDIHPDDLMRREGQFMCLENDPMNMDVLRRHEDTLKIYPEVTVGCEAISRKPLKKHFDDPSHGTTFDEEIRKHFIIDATGVEQLVNKSSPVVIEVYTSGFTSQMVPNATRSRTKLEFNFHEICFPIACYESADVFHQACVTDVQAATKSSFVNFDCLPEPGNKNPGKYGSTKFCRVPEVTKWRELFKGHTGATTDLDPKTSVYCIGSGPTLGPLRTRQFPVGQVFMSGRKGKHIGSFRKYVHQYDLYTGEPTQKLLKRGSFITYSSGAYVNIEGKKFFLGCAISAPIEAPYNDTFGMQFLIMRELLNKQVQPLTIKKGDLIDLKLLYTSDEPESRGPSQFIKFEDLCFPADCKGKAVEDYKCKAKYKETKIEGHISSPTLSYVAHELIYQHFLYPFDYEHVHLAAKVQTSLKHSTL